jgi:hypothetical protein
MFLSYLATFWLYNNSQCDLLHVMVPSKAFQRNNSVLVIRELYGDTWWSNSHSNNFSMINGKKIQIPLPTGAKKTKLFGAHVQSAPRSNWLLLGGEKHSIPKTPPGGDRIGGRLIGLPLMFIGHLASHLWWANWSPSYVYWPSCIPFVVG